MSKTIPFGRNITFEEFAEIAKSTLHVYAYCELHYSSKSSTGLPIEHLLRGCSLYNAQTTFFQHTPFFNFKD